MGSVALPIQITKRRPRMKLYIDTTNYNFIQLLPLPLMMMVVVMMMLMIMVGMMVMMMAACGPKWCPTRRPTWVLLATPEMVTEHFSGTTASAPFGP